MRWAAISGVIVTQSSAHFDNGERTTPTTTHASSMTFVPPMHDIQNPYAKLDETLDTIIHECDTLAILSFMHLAASGKEMNDASLAEFKKDHPDLHSLAYDVACYLETKHELQAKIMPNEAWGKLGATTQAALRAEKGIRPVKESENLSHALAYIAEETGLPQRLYEGHENGIRLSLLDLYEYELRTRDVESAVAQKP